MEETFGNCEIVKRQRLLYFKKCERIMRAVDIIQKKRDGLALNKEEIEWLIEGYVAGTVPDYQMSAFAMAFILKG